MPPVWATAITATRTRRRRLNGTLTACGMRATERLADQGAGGEGPASPCSHHRPTVRAAHHCSPPHTGPAVPGPGRPAAAHLAQVRLPPRLPDMVALICQAPGTRVQIR